MGHPKKPDLKERHRSICDRSHIPLGIFELVSSHKVSRKRKMTQGAIPELLHGLPGVA
jgi:hypothetical protein